MNGLLRTACAVSVLVMATVFSAGPANAGGWAVTYLDPMPKKIEPGETYTVGFWVLQHGDHPPEPESLVEDAALKLTNDQGDELVFDGVRLREKAHWATALAVPEGTWKVTGLQGIFDPHDIGTLTVPGGITIDKVDLDDRGGPDHGDETAHWGTVRPPIQEDHDHLPAAGPTGPTGPSGQTGPRASAPPETEVALWPYAAGAVAAMGGGLVLVARRLIRSRRSRRS